jgi:twitching motility two-component system response regulator PilG
MPEMDGFALCAAIRADPALQRVPVVLLTSHDEETRRRGRLVGATDFLEKPLSMVELRDLVARLLHLDPDFGSFR